MSCNLGNKLRCSVPISHDIVFLRFTGVSCDKESFSKNTIGSAREAHLLQTLSLRKRLLQEALYSEGKQTMGVFRLLLVIIFVCIFGYTAIVGVNHGWNLLSVFFCDIAAMNWAGQFNLDFMSFLALSGLWLAWRHHFSPGGLALGVLGFFGGIMVVAPYLFFASFKANGDMKVLLLGKARAKS